VANGDYSGGFWLTVDGVNVAFVPTDFVMSGQETFRTRVDVARESVPNAVVTAIAAIENVPRCDLPCLYYAVDPDALEALLASKTGSVSVTFRYHGYRVDISGEGVLSVEVVPT